MLSVVRECQGQSISGNDRNSAPTPEIPAIPVKIPIKVPRLLAVYRPEWTLSICESTLPGHPADRAGLRPARIYGTRTRVANGMPGWGRGVEFIREAGYPDGRVGADLPVFLL